MKSRFDKRNKFYRSDFHAAAAFDSRNVFINNAHILRAACLGGHNKVGLKRNHGLKIVLPVIGIY